MKLSELLKTVDANQPGIYLLRFERKFGGEKHKIEFYGGYSNNVSGRLYYHSIGQGSAITRHALKMGISWQVVYLAEGTPADEKAMKAYKNYRQFLASKGIQLH